MKCIVIRKISVMDLIPSVNKIKGLFVLIVTSNSNRNFYSSQRL